MQSPESGWCFLDWRKRWIWGSRTLLGGNRPVHNQSSSQPFSSLYLQQHTTHVQLKATFYKVTEKLTKIPSAMEIFGRTVTMIISFPWVKGPKFYTKFINLRWNPEYCKIQCIRHSFVFHLESAVRPIYQCKMQSDVLYCVRVCYPKDGAMVEVKFHKHEPSCQPVQLPLAQLKSSMLPSAAINYWTGMEQDCRRDMVTTAALQRVTQLHRKRMLWTLLNMMENSLDWLWVGKTNMFFNFWSERGNVSLMLHLTKSESKDSLMCVCFKCVSNENKLTSVEITCVFL